MFETLSASGKYNKTVLFKRFMKPWTSSAFVCNRLQKNDGVISSCNTKHMDDHMTILNDAWTITLRNNGGDMEQKDLMPEMNDLVKIYEKEMEQNKQSRDRYVEYIISYMSEIVEHHQKYKETKYKLDVLQHKLGNADDGDE